MTSKMLSLWIRFAIIAIAVCGLYLCICAYPFITSLSSFTDTISELKLWAWLIFLWTVSIPCFVILIFVWKVTYAIKNETAFSTRVAKQVKLCAQILFLDSGMLLIGGIVFTVLRIIDLFIPIVFILVLSGLALAIFAAVLSRYIAKAAVLKEENEGTI
jgi:hypothetical protein